MIHINRRLLGYLVGETIKTAGTVIGDSISRVKFVEPDFERLEKVMQKTHNDLQKVIQSLPANYSSHPYSPPVTNGLKDKLISAYNVAKQSAKTAEERKRLRDTFKELYRTVARARGKEPQQKGTLCAGLDLEESAEKLCDNDIGCAEEIVPHLFSLDSGEITENEFNSVVDEILRSHGVIHDGVNFVDEINETAPCNIKTRKLF